MLMTQTPLSALQGQNTASSYSSASSAAAAAAHPQSKSTTASASLAERGTYTPFFSTSTTAMNGIAAAPPAGTMYVRALYDYEADDRTSLSFHEGDIIQVITQLESGWWDGVINGVRGWFPSNYCQTIHGPDEAPDAGENGDNDHVDDDMDEQDLYDESFDDDEGSDQDDVEGLPMEGTDGDRSRADFWIPQATPDGRLFYYNTMTGESSMELPLESPSSMSETGPRDRMTVNMPERTRPPPEIMARGMMQDEEDESDVNSASELEGEALMNASRGSLVRKPGPHQASPPESEAYRTSSQPVRRNVPGDGLSPSVSMDSINGQSPVARVRADTFPTSNFTSQTPMIASATSFTSAAFSLPNAASIPRSFFDDGTTPPLTWHRLVTNMKKAIDRYRDAVEAENRSEYVARAEDISDHLRLLLAAGSGTTDNHSGQPSIISTNKALYPHFRDMMSKFSKLVISSHIAAADWPNAESVQKCQLEAEGVLHGVYSYVEVARQQRGEDIPRLFPGFVIGSNTGGSWQNNGLGPRDPIASNFLEDEEGTTEPTAYLDGKLLERLDEQKRMLVFSIRELDKHLTFSETYITPRKHEVLGNAVCGAGGKVLEIFKPWIAMIESIDLSSLENSFKTPPLNDFHISKQSLYDNISDLVLGCQAVSGPLADEWSEVRGQALAERLEYVRTCAKALETNASHIGFVLQLLSEQVQINMQQPDTRQRMDVPQPVRRDTMPYERAHMRTESRGLLARPGLPMSQSFSEGELVAPTSYSRKGDPSKMKRFFGEDPSPLVAAQAAPIDDTPDFLRLDYEKDLSWDLKTPQPTVKGGSLLALVEQLTRHDKLDANFNNTFLLTYRSFTTARELFELLVKRFSIQPPDGLTLTEAEQWRDGKQKLIRFRVVNILKSWFDNFWMEDMTDDTKQLMRDVYNFAKDTVKSTETPGSAPLMAVLDQRLSGKEASRRQMVQTIFSQNTPAPIMPKNMKKLKFLDIDVIEFARQLTIIESRLYGKIKATECLNKTWQKKVGEGEPEPAPNVKALILHSNQMTNWVAEMILMQTDVRKRVVVIKHFVAVADVSFVGVAGKVL